MSEPTIGSTTMGDEALRKKNFPPRTPTPEPAPDPSSEPRQAFLDTRPTRDETFMEVARVLRLRSTCLRGRVGVVLVAENRIIASGYNGAPPGTAHCFELGCAVDENNHVSGCQRAVHAEVNAIAFAARHGTSTRGATMFCTAGPCLKCAQQVISAGVVRHVYGIPYRLPEGLSLLIENGIEVVRLNPFEPQFRRKFDE